MARHHSRHRAPWVPLFAAWPPLMVLGAAAGWGEGSQQQARRNALVASSALLQRRQERIEVEEFLVDHAARRADPEAVADAAAEPA